MDTRRNKVRPAKLVCEERTAERLGVNLETQHEIAEARLRRQLQEACATIQGLRLALENETISCDIAKIDIKALR